MKLRLGMRVLGGGLTLWMISSFALQTRVLPPLTGKHSVREEHEQPQPEHEFDARYPVQELLELTVPKDRSHKTSRQQPQPQSRASLGDGDEELEDEEVEALMARATNRTTAFIQAMVFPEPNDLFVSVQNHKRIRSRQPMQPKLVTKLLPPESPHLSYNTCAVVGNSGSLKRSAFGEYIDRHEAVLRLNQAPVASYEHIVGSKTTFRFLNNKWTTVYYEDNVPNVDVPGGTSQLARFLIKQEQPNTTLVVARAPTRSFEELANTVQRRRPDVSTLYLSSRVVSQARRALLVFRAGNGDRAARGPQAETTPSTGFIGMMFLLQVCRQVSVYGFSLEESRYAAEMKAAGASYHYFKHWVDSEQLRAHPHHSFTLEGDLIERLHESGKIWLCAGKKARVLTGGGCGWTAALDVVGGSSDM
mmetsp:Transcript_40839/g.77988  ORF Transcript_40839/g.77988 Transcript_40839/m.77988 type:complete len:418 (+) Transcript_40839:431-1684(+)